MVRFKILRWLPAGKERLKPKKKQKASPCVRTALGWRSDAYADDMLIFPSESAALAFLAKNEEEGKAVPISEEEEAKLRKAKRLE